MSIPSLFSHMQTSTYKLDYQLLQEGWGSPETARGLWCSDDGVSVTEAPFPPLLVASPLIDDSSLVPARFSTTIGTPTIPFLELEKSGGGGSFFARGSSDGHVCGGGRSSAPQRREHANNTREPLYVSQGELTNDKDLDDEVALLDDLANVELDIGAMWREVIAWEADVAVQEKEEPNVPCHDVEYVDVDDDMAYHP
ncbi:hypothetical protein J5N97_011419 [Dioscorea zingiberensis]|uniref:Uncharacterized protein n=1 Tax=Dioscorea zingiberensis TaxID=325984 RepID=A0A9D5HNH8_9LILI|nr:hypothetical protein J5N97_011419 [Dioscorea zingiberensis]